eukprot:c2123_g1_i2 orf=69-419(+)
MYSSAVVVVEANEARRLLIDGEPLHLPLGAPLHHELGKEIPNQATFIPFDMQTTTHLLTVDATPKIKVRQYYSVLAVATELCEATVFIGKMLLMIIFSAPLNTFRSEWRSGSVVGP